MELPEGIELQDLGPTSDKEEDDGDYETPFSWGEDFDRFTAEGPRHFFGVDPVNHS